MKKNLLFGLLMSGLVFAGCKESEANRVIGNWKVQEFEKDGSKIPIEESGISFEQESENVFKVNGNSGINTFFGNVEIKNKGIVVDDKMASTKMAGSPEAMEYEDNFLLCLTGADGIELDESDGKKVLKLSSSKNNMTIHFVPAE